MVDLLRCAGPDFHVNFPHNSAILKNDGFANTDGLDYLGSIDTRYNHIRYQYNDGVNASNGATDGTNAVSRNGTFDMIYSGLTPTSYTTGTYTKPLDSKYLNNERQISIYNICRKDLAFVQLGTNGSMYRQFESTCYRGPVSFLTSESYVVDFSNPTIKQPLSTFDFSTISDFPYGYLVPSAVFPPQTNYDVYPLGGGEAIASGAVSMSIADIKNVGWQKYKLLNKTDWELCKTVNPTSLDVSFYDSLTSPTLTEAIANGGASYWGVFKFFDMPITQTTITYNMEASHLWSGSWVGYPSNYAQSSCSIGFIGRTSDSFATYVTISDVDDSYSETRSLTYRQESSLTAPNEFTPSIILRY